MGKYVLPWFGGAPAVWTTCMCVFQALLLAGYIYAHALSGIRERSQVRVHVILLLASLTLLFIRVFAWPSPITPGLDWKPDSNYPIRNIVSMLTLSIGFPFLLLASTGPLLQRWFADTRVPFSPYRFFAFSNLGSLLGLLSYPVLVEPYLPLAAEGRFWFCGYLLFSIGTLACARAARGTDERSSSVAPSTDASGKPVSRPPWSTVLLWFGLPACGSLMLLATTNVICQDVAAVPLLWVFPLSLYLITFIWTFGNDRWYRRGWVHPGLVLAAFSAYVALSPWDALIDPTSRIFIFSATLFLCCLGCHGELARLKPDPRHLTFFYLVVALGGWAGGVVSSLLAPVIFPDFWEFHLGLWASLLLIGVVLVRDKRSWLYLNRPWVPFVMLFAMVSLRGRVALALLVPVGVHLAGWQAVSLLGLGVAGACSAIRGRKKAPLRGRGGPLRWTSVSAAALMILLTWGLLKEINADPANRVARSRDFYGVLTVEEEHRGNVEEDAYELRHGGTLHGLQFLNPERRRQATSYYGQQTGIALALRYHPARMETPPRPLRVGVIGLGVGTIAVYAHQGDYLRFYEIDPEVVRMSSGDHPYFTFLRDSAGRVEVIPGDARISLQREADRGEIQQFDVLVIDAFEGDAVPVHLLTKEAFRLYLAHIRWPNGILAINVSNRSLDLEPVIASLARTFGLHGSVVHSASREKGLRPNHWILLFKSDAVLHTPQLEAHGRPLMNPEGLPLWTDQYSNVFSVLR